MCVCCGGSVCVCLSVHREVCTSFFCTHTPPPLSCDRINDDEDVLRGGDRQLWQKKIAQDAVCIRVCLRNVRSVFSQHQRPPPFKAYHRGSGGAGGIILFSREEQKKAKRLAFFYVSDLSLLHFTAYVLQN